MAFKKYYDCTCDICGCHIATYTHYKPIPTELRKSGINIKINNGHILTFCDKCYKPMTQQQFERAIQIAKRLEELQLLKREINANNDCKLVFTCINGYYSDFIRDLLDKHKSSIKHEIDLEIKNLKEEIDKL